MFNFQFAHNSMSNRERCTELNNNSDRVSKRVDNHKFI